MPKQYDATTRFLVEANPRALLAFIGVAANDVELLNTDLSTVTARADPVLRVLDPVPYLVHIEFQSGYDASMGRRLLRYNGLLIGDYDLPVESVVVLLRREADGPAMSGIVEYAPPGGRYKHSLEFRVVRVWERSVDEVLAGGLEMLPFAPITDVREEALPAVISRMEERLRAEATPQAAQKLWVSALVLMGLKYRSELIDTLLKGVRGMED